MLGMAWSSNYSLGTGPVDTKLNDKHARNFKNSTGTLPIPAFLRTGPLYGDKPADNVVNKPDSADNTERQADMNRIVWQHLLRYMVAPCTS